LVSIVIPAYNAEAYIEDALNSALRQTYPSIEVIVVDDGSTDRTAERTAAYHPRVHLCRRANSGGYPGAARNTGIERSSGEYICFLDADDVMLPDRVAIQVEFLATHPEVGVVFCDYRNFRGEEVLGRTHFEACARVKERLGSEPSLVLSSAEATGLLARENFGSGSMMIRREVLGLVPAFSSELQVGEDFHYYYRVARSYAVGLVNHVGFLRRLHDRNITGDPIRVLRNLIASRRDLKNAEVSRANRKALEEFLFACEIDLACAHADRLELKSAFGHNLRALYAALPASPGRFWVALWTIARTGAIAVRLWRSASS
jgi:glycosyltransferase involved in cell wall biosynthesis